MIPLVHDLEDATVLVFGGGPVGARKANRFGSTARVIVVSPMFVDGAFDGAELVRADPTPAEVPAWLERVDPALAVAATDDPAVNVAVEEAAIAAGMLINRADTGGSRAPMSVIVPATVRSGPVLVAVTTAGTDPLLSRAVRTRLEGSLETVPAVARALDSVRTHLESAGVDEAVRLEATRAVAVHDAVWEAAEADGASVESVAMTVAEAVVAGRDEVPSSPG